MDQTTDAYLDMNFGFSARRRASAKRRCALPDRHDATADGLAN
jgi:hypothetical protein